MLPLLQINLLRGDSASPVFQRTIALVVVVLFSFQLSRFYLTDELNPLECLDHNHSHEATSAHSHEATSAHSQQHQQHHHESESVPESPESDDNGHYFQHCKDLFADMALTSSQLPGISVTVVQPPLAQVSVTFLPKDIRPAENFLLPPFHPPRHLGESLLLK